MNVSVTSPRRGELRRVTPVYSLSAPQQYISAVKYRVPRGTKKQDKTIQNGEIPRTLLTGRGGEGVNLFIMKKYINGSCLYDELTHTVAVGRTSPKRDQYQSV